LIHCCRIFRLGDNGQQECRRQANLFAGLSVPILAVPAGGMTLIKTVLFSMALVVFAPGSVVAQPMEKKGTTPYVTHFIFRPLMSIDIPGLGTATNLEAVGTTQNMKGEKMFDKM
jgi:hypothetical protein